MSGSETVITDRRPEEMIRSSGPESGAVEPDPSAGAWPEEMGGVSVYADTALTIPGTADPPADCGTWGPKTYCTSCGEPHFGPHKCETRECERCADKWRLERAGAITRRLAGARRAADAPERKRLVHVVVSPPDPTDPDTPRSEEVRTLTQFEKAKKKAYALAKEKGIRGGALVPHGWRVREEAKQLYRELKDVGEVPPEKGVWDWIRKRPEDWRTLTYWSPHFHILGLAVDVGESDPENDGGWVVHRVDHQGRSAFPAFDLYDKETYRPMFRAAAYLLSHAAFEPDEGKQAVRWFGSLSPGEHGISLEEELSEWEREKIDQLVNELGVGGEEAGTLRCKRDPCEGDRSPIWSAGSALADQRWCEKIDDQREARLSAAFEWAVGEVVPPPGARYPETREGCEEVFELVREQR